MTLTHSPAGRAWRRFPTPIIRLRPIEDNLLDAPHMETGRPRRSCARRGRRRADPQPHIALALAADSQPIPRHLDVERGEPRLDARRRLCGLCGPRKVASMERPPMYARTIERELWMDEAAECPKTWQSNARRADRRRWERIGWLHSVMASSPSSSPSWSWN